jgi:hypothetical protein
VTHFVVRHGRRIEVETLSTSTVTPKKKRHFEYAWIKVPRHWVTGLARTKSAATYQLALAILVEAFKRKHIGGKVVLSTKVTGITSRHTRMRATLELVEFGLIEVKFEPRKATEITNIVL